MGKGLQHGVQHFQTSETLNCTQTAKKFFLLASTFSFSSFPHDLQKMHFIATHPGQVYT
jgi:hypothetical protein